MAKRKTVLHIEGVTPEPAPAASQVEGTQVTDAGSAAIDDAAEPAEKVAPVEEAPEATEAKPTAEREEKTAAPTTHHKVRTAVALDPVPAQEEELLPQPAPQPKSKPKAKPQAKATVQTPEREAAPAARQATATKGKKALKRMPEPLANLVANHTNAVLGGAIGLVVAVMVFVVGFWQTLFVSALVTVGVAVGQYLDGDPKIINALRRLLLEARGDERG